MDNYINLATRTESLEHFKVDRPRLLHAVIGISTEVTELLLSNGDRVNMKEEMGDILWYVAIAADDLEVTFGDFFRLGEPPADQIRGIVSAAGDGLDVMKRALYYGSELDEAKLGQAIGTVLCCLDLLAEDEGWTLSQLQQSNIAKLSTRYPEKFTTEASESRDIEAEMEAITNA